MASLISYVAYTIARKLYPAFYTLPEKLESEDHNAIYFPENSKYICDEVPLAKNPVACAKKPVVLHVFPDFPQNSSNSENCFAGGGCSPDYVVKTQFPSSPGLITAQVGGIQEGGLLKFAV